ncbi:MAG: Sulfotransferase domain superfamily [uncultured Solirubrobacteraceae bacterium]|uniref:Sulfotransferase domain superfamily n=1 Tax=uncultured Solirubrobacteraceae bacterium TaxID=1162706 RepID=A0A6J4RX30_9ACTN|nr:MAG: Sulfotransferase domain superfamily [uncultured Solirubrobacteraceae bacterium]
MTAAGTPASPAPFVVGVPRSGTTLLRLMLDAHPALAVPPETHFVPRALSAAQAQPGGASTFWHIVVSSERFGDFGIDADELRRRIDALRPFEAAEGVRAFYRLYAERQGKPRWGDKTPSYLASMLIIAAALPEARVVHIIRDGRDVACSIVPLGFGPDSVAEAAAWWSAGIARARAQAASLPGYLEIRYEDLVTRTAETLHPVCDLVDLPFAPAMLEYHRNAGARMAEIERDLPARDGSVLLTASERAAMHALTRDPPRAAREGRWRRDMTPEDQRDFEAVAGPLLAELGYPLRWRNSA